MQKKSLRLCFATLLMMVFLFPTFGTEAHPFSDESLSKGLPDKIGGRWKTTATFRKLNASEIPLNNDAKILLEYGLQSVTKRLYTNGKDILQVESLEMKYISGAYGLWTFRRQLLVEGQKEFFTGQYLIRVSAPTSAIADDVCAQMQTNLPPTSDLPLLPTYLPDQTKLIGSEKYLIGPMAVSQVLSVSDLKDGIDFTGGTHAVVADYNNGSGKMSVILIEFQSPQFATDGLAKIQQHFNSLSAEEQKKRIIRRVGNYAVEAVNVTDLKAAEELLGQIKYMARVYWEGKGMASIPLQFRPPDPIAVQEAIQTGHFIVATFYWIGVLVLGAVIIGVLSGGAFFYWRRAQRGQMGVDEIFSDAGGMTRLNLDNYLLTDSNTSRKLTGKKE